MLRELGFPVLDADSMAHELIEPGCRAYDEIVREFGAAVLGADKKSIAARWRRLFSPILPNCKS